MIATFAMPGITGVPNGALERRQMNFAIHPSLSAVRSKRIVSLYTLRSKELHIIWDNHKTTKTREQWIKNKLLRI
jgi:hypothetical protein